MKLSKVSRRMFLAGGGGAAMTIPFLPSLLRSQAHAQPSRDLKYVLLASPYTLDQTMAYPFGPDHSAPAPVTQLDDATKVMSLNEIVAAKGHVAPGLSSEAWDRLRPYMNIIMGSTLNGTNDKHNSCAVTAASMPHDVLQDEHPANDNPVFKYSADFVAEQLLATSRHAYPALRLNLAFRHGAEHGNIWSEYQNYAFGGPQPDNPGYAQVLPMMRDVAELEQRLGRLGEAEGDQALSHRQKLIDAVRDDYRDVISSPQLSTADRERLQQAIDLWNDAENRLRAGAPMCAPPTLMSVGEARAGWDVYHDYALDLVAYALACGVTSVVSYALQHGDVGNHDYDKQLSYHGDAHDGSARVIPEVFAFRLERVARFGNRLLELQDEEGQSLLESTMLLWGHEYTATGAHPNAGHWHLTLGRAGGRLETGHYLDVMGEATVESYYGVYEDCVPYNRILLTTLLAIGHTNESIEAITSSVGFGEYGDVALGTNDHRRGASFGWSNGNRQRFYSDAEKRRPLPIFQDV